MLKEFREFIMHGNVLDLAVGVIIGGAFGKIIGSLVNEILMPLIGLVIGGINFSEQTCKIGTSIIGCGLFLQSIIDFLIIASVIFVIIKFANKLKKTPPPVDSITKECPHCFSVISIKATRCPNCTSEIK